MKNMLARAAIVLMCCASALPMDAFADELSASDAVVLYRKKIKLIQYYVGGLGAGIRASNALAQVSHLDKLYCVPAGGTLSDDQMMDILESYLKSNPDNAKIDVNTTLMFAINQALPCPRQR